MSITPAQGATQAVRFLRQFYRDLRAMIQTCDDLLDAKGWHPPRSKRVAEVSSRVTRPEGWLVDSLLRIYLPSEKSAQETICIAPVLDLKGFDEATCLVVRAHFAKAQVHGRIWKDWSGCGPLIRYLAEHRDTSAVPLAVLRDGTLPQAVSGRAFLVSLAELVDRDAVRKRLIEPALALDALPPTG